MLESLYGNYRQRKFTDVYTQASDFVTDYKASGLYNDSNKISDTAATNLYYLLYARYGNSTIASSDTNRFKYNLFSIIFVNGPTWEKKLDIQNKLRAINESSADFKNGNQTFVNRADNPGQSPATDQASAVGYTNNQEVSTKKRGTIESYAILASMLEEDVTSQFLDKFKNLFLRIVEPELPLWYVSEEEDQND